MRQAMLIIILLPIRLYRILISPFMPNCCRFSPSCSEYAEKALRLHGPGRGLILAACRLLRCHPFCSGGYDPVPEPNPNPRKEINEV